MADRYVKKCSVSLIISVINKTTMKNHLTHFKMAVTKKKNKNK